VKKRVYVRVVSGCLRCPAGFLVNLEDSESLKTKVVNAKKISTVTEGQTEGRDRPSRTLGPYQAQEWPGSWTTSKRSDLTQVR
jgi:mRNA-degrading endonuclease toxin of MazEF toxin-antitoxin module